MWGKGGNPLLHLLKTMAKRTDIDYGDSKYWHYTPINQANITPNTNNPRLVPMTAGAVSQLTNENNESDE